MIQGQERVQHVPTAIDAGGRARYRALLLLDDVLLGSPDLGRVAIISAAMTLQMIVLFMPGHFRPAPNAALAVFIPVAMVASLALALAVGVPLKRLLPLRARQALAAAGLLGTLVLAGVGTWEGALGVQSMMHGTPYGNDGAAMDTYAAQQVRHGHNPYFKTNIVSALAAINAPSTTTTPLMDGQFRGAQTYPSVAAINQVFNYELTHPTRRGVPTPPEFESKYNYPAGSFLFILPFVWMGFHDMRFLYGLALVAMAAYLAWRLPRALRLLGPLLILADIPLVIMTTSGQPDPLYGLFLLVGYAEWPTMWLSPVAMGLAIGTKQLAWFFVPLYLALMFRQFGWRQVVRRSAIMSLVFLVLNGPFIALSPVAYVSSISGPMSDPMFPLGVGVIALFVGNVLPMLPKVAFTLAELGVWAGATVASVRARFLVPAGAAALGALPLLFAWRSLMNYFYLVPLLALAIVLADDARKLAGPSDR